MARMTYLQAMCPNANQVGAHLRVVAPLSFLRREMDLHVSYHTELELHTMSTADIILIQRPFSDGCVQRAKIAKLTGAQLWIDWDDDMPAIPKGNKAYSFYQFPQLLDNIAELQSLADVITVTNPKLIDVYGGDRGKYRIVPNAIEDRMIPKKPPSPMRKCIMWRGSDSHVVDFAAFRQPLTAFAKENAPQWKYVFFGVDPTPLILTDLSENSWRCLDEMEYYPCMDTMQSFASPIHIVPLDDIPFNHGKSNLAYLEATMAGSCVLAPDWPEFNQPGAWHYKDIEDFGVQLESMTNNLDLCIEKNLQAWEHVTKNYRLSKVNELRKDIINELMSK